MSRTILEQMKKEWFEMSPTYRLTYTVLTIVSLAIFGLILLRDAVDALAGMDSDVYKMGMVALAVVSFCAVWLLTKPIIRIMKKGNPELCEWLKEADKPYEVAEKDKKKDPDYPRKQDLNKMFAVYNTLSVISLVLVTTAGWTWLGGPFAWASYVFVAGMTVLMSVIFINLTLNHADRINKRYGRKMEIIEGHRDAFFKERRAVLFKTAVLFVGLCACSAFITAMLVEFDVLTELDGNSMFGIALAHWMIVYSTLIACSIWAQDVLAEHKKVVWYENPDDPSLAFAAYLFDKKRD